MAGECSCVETILLNGEVVLRRLGTKGEVLGIMAVMGMQSYRKRYDDAREIGNVSLLFGEDVTVETTWAELSAGEQIAYDVCVTETDLLDPSALVEYVPIIAYEDLRFMRPVEAQSAERATVQDMPLTGGPAVLAA